MTTTQTEAPFSKEAFISAWVDSADIQGWASFVNNIQAKGDSYQPKTL